MDFHHIAIYGAGYVGLSCAVCLAKIGHQVTCVDINQERVARLREGECPIYEEGLPELLKEQLALGRLQFTTDAVLANQKAQVHFIATGTPSLLNGEADLSAVYAVASHLAQHAVTQGLVVIKSTVPVGTSDALQAYINEELNRYQKPYGMTVASNPEFLREGSAVDDFLNADRIIIGGNSDALAILATIYQPLTEKGIPLLKMSCISAELSKYAANAMLASRISFINEISCIAEKVGANIEEIRQGIGTDQRIGPLFLQAGIGFGGSCFPKDGRALVHTAKALGIEVPMLEAIESVNQRMKHWVLEKLNHYFHHDLHHKVIGIWGLSFKPGTDDLREASSLVIIDSLLQIGAKLRLYDPIALPMLRATMPYHEGITWCTSATDVLDGPIDALVIATEWPVFKAYSLSALQQALSGAPVIDGRNCFELSDVKKAQFTYYSVGRPVINHELSSEKVL